jgi:imidazoleglycerol-phosphate dehydratase / histidinol-phosphatase
MRKILFIDRDGTLILEPGDEQIDSLDKLEFYPGVFTWLGKIARETNYELVLVTNQDGLGTSRFPEEDFWPAHNKMIAAFEKEGIRFSSVHIDRSMPSENKPTRKPGTGMLNDYLQGDVDLANSFVIGDRITDIQLAKNLGAKGILLGGTNGVEKKLEELNLREYCSRMTSSWEDVYNEITQRRASVSRVTKETSINILINLDGSGKSAMTTGLGFFDHMLDQVARHGLIDLEVRVAGDLHIDEHHTIEDTALALGQCLREALGNKKGIERYGLASWKGDSGIPMDDCLAQVAIDFGGRPWLVWAADFHREKIGEMPTEMFLHFFKSFSDNAKCNLNIKAEGQNEHHKIEAIFKAFARAVKMAVRHDPFHDDVPSTKGTL